MDLGRCVDALERRQNFIYQWNFVRALRARMRRKDQCHPGRFDLATSSIRTVRAFDDRYTAPYFGFAGADYYRASALRVIDRIRVPALIITSDDDPFVPSEPFRDPAVTGNPNIQVLITEHGGHCAFVAEASRRAMATGPRIGLSSSLAGSFVPPPNTDSSAPWVKPRIGGKTPFPRLSEAGIQIALRCRQD